MPKHLRQHNVAPLLGRLRKPVRPVGIRRARQTRQRGGLCQRHVLARFAEILPRRRFDAVCAAPQEDLVEVQLEDLVLGEFALKLQCHKCFFGLPLHGAFGRHSRHFRDISHNLHGDCAGAAHAARPNRILKRARNRQRAHPFVYVKRMIFGRDEGLLQVQRNFVQTHELPRLDRVLAEEHPIRGIDPAAHFRAEIIHRLDICPGVIEHPHEHPQAHTPARCENEHQHKKDAPAATGFSCQRTSQPTEFFALSCLLFRHDVDPTIRFGNSPRTATARAFLSNPWRDTGVSRESDPGAKPPDGAGATIRTREKTAQPLHPASSRPGRPA